MKLAAYLADALAPWLTTHPDRVWIAVIATFALVGLNAILWNRNARAGTLACFPCVAVSAGILQRLLGRNDARSLPGGRARSLADDTS